MKKTVPPDVRQQLVALLPRLRRFAHGLCGSQDAADDLVQSACERALARLHQWQADSRLDSWMFRIIKTIWIDQWRSAQVRGETAAPEEAESVAGSDGRRITEAQHTLEVVCRAMDRLPADQRLVLVLVTVEGLSYQEAADVLEVPLGTVMSRLARARLRLHESLHGGKADTFAQESTHHEKTR